MENKNGTKKNAFFEFLDKRGFYVVLFLCVVIVGATAVYVSTRSKPDENTEDKIGVEDNSENSTNDLADNTGMMAQDNKGNVNIVMPDTNEILNAGEVSSQTGKTIEQASEDNAKPEDQSSISTEPDEKAADSGSSVTLTQQNNASAVTDAVNKSSAENEQSTPELVTQNENEIKASFVMPVFGEISNGYAMDELIYSATLDEWRTHEGIDITADKGAVVKAAMDGTVKEITADDKYGITVVIDHGNGLLSYYSNLASNDVVMPNQIVKQGDAIGSVGETALYEIADKTHLHFEVSQNGVNKDPALYFQVINKETRQ